MAETVGETGAETTVVTAVGPVAAPPREPEKQYICSHCGAEVVPRWVGTPSGTSNRRPECNKFMEPLARKEV